MKQGHYYGYEQIKIKVRSKGKTRLDVATEKNRVSLSNKPEGKNEARTLLMMNKRPL